jgi:hypothetical protein
MYSVPFWTRPIPSALYVISFESFWRHDEIVYKSNDLEGKSRSAMLDAIIASRHLTVLGIKK